VDGYRGRVFLLDLILLYYVSCSGAFSDSDSEMKPFSEREQCSDEHPRIWEGKNLPLASDVFDL
jgi:hypothetical protein